MAWRRIERDKVDDVERKLDRYVGGQGRARRNSQRVSDLDMTASADAEFFGLWSSAVTSAIRLAHGMTDEGAPE